MKKLTIIFIIAGLSILMPFNMTSAKDMDGWGAINGTYEMVANGSCLHSPSDFTMTSDALGNPLYIPNDSNGVWGATTSAVGTWEFYSDGTGHADIWNYPIDFPPGSDSWGPRARSQNLVYDIKYKVKKDSIVIKLYVPDGTFSQQRGELVGSVSLDKKILTIPSDLQYINFGGPPLYTAVCNTMRVFIRVVNAHPKTR